MPGVRLGLSLATVTPPVHDSRQEFNQIVQVAAAAEDSGFDALFVPDRVIPGHVRAASATADSGPMNGESSQSSTPIFEVNTLLGALAVRTRTIQLGTLCSDFTLRNPAVLA
jgi:alkanesulfonate monooxygenase SsuD/methylene tetrahydromethanopterin reductase-like flavin-dependent oxidoreductase (luciferase family)